MLVAAVDVGSWTNMGWACSSGHLGCGNPAELVVIITEQLERGGQVAFGFEAPLWVPRARLFERMTANRGGIEATMRRPWSAGAGCGSLAAGVANMAWFFEALAKSIGPVTTTTQIDRLLSGQARLLLWEAFVSGNLKSRTHAADAELAVAAFRSAWPKLESAVDVEASVNLAAATALAAGHQISTDELGMAGTVVAALG